MEDGHPFLTKELDALRQQQRRVLRTVPEWVIDRVAIPYEPVESSSAGDRAYAELELRKLAQDAIVEQQELLASFDRGTTDEMLAAAISNLIQKAPRGLFDALQPLSDDAYDRRKASAVRNMEGDQTAPLTRLLALLIWADALAGDYRDPRLKASPT
ncbi:MAG: hypothetical protein JO086_08280 [Acidimicrobiia bacterium]|nr:hypothetical protein [Acidimicrobiia bacterium]